MNTYIAIATNPWSYLVLFIIAGVVIWLLWKDAFRD